MKECLFKEGKRCFCGYLGPCKNNNGNKDGWENYLSKGIKKEEGKEG